MCTQVHKADYHKINNKPFKIQIKLSMYCKNVKCLTNNMHKIMFSTFMYVGIKIGPNRTQLSMTASDNTNSVNY